MMDSLTQSPPEWGAGDIYCLGSPDIDRLLSAVAVLAGMATDDGLYADGVFVVLPPPVSGGSLEADIWAGLAAVYAELSGRPATPEVAAWLTQRVRVVTLQDFQVSSLVAAFEDAAPRSAFVVEAAASYRLPEVVAAPSPELRQFEAIWTVHLTATADKCLEICRAKGAYVLLDAGQNAPSEQDSLDRLMSVDGCGVITCHRKPNVLDDNLSRWSALIASGGIGAVMAEIDALLSDDLIKGRLNVQMLSRAGLHAPAMEQLGAQLEMETDLPADLAVVFAHVALAAGDEERVADLIRIGAPRLTGQEELDAALVMADQITDRALTDLVAERLRQLFPLSSRLADLDIVRAIAAHDYAGAGQRAASAGRSEDARFYGWLDDALARQREDTASLISEAGIQWPDRVRFMRDAAARLAEGRRDYIEAVHIRLGEDEDRTFPVLEILHLVRLMRLRLLQGERSNALDADLIAVVRSAFATLAAHSDSPALRARVGALLSAEASGSLGYAAAAMAFIELIDAPLVVLAAEHDDEVEEDVSALLRSVEAWQETEALMAIGRSRFPARLLPDNFDPRIDRLLLRVLERVAEDLDTESDVTAALRVTGVVAALAPHLRDPDTDIMALRVMAARLVASGRPQRARDLIETVLQIAEDRAARHRLAWFAYGDVYLRTGDRGEALIAMGAGLASVAEISTDQAWTETQALTRLLRDMSFFGPARRALNRGVKILAASDLLEANQSVVDALGLQIDLREIESADTAAPERIEAILAKSIRSCRAALEHRPELAPVATLLGQCMRLARAHGVAVPGEAVVVLEEAMTRVGEPLAEALRIYNADTPTAEDLATLAARLETARFATDAGYDLGNLALVARRYLGGSAQTGDPKLAAYAVELLSDQTLAIEADFGAGPLKPGDSNTPISIAIEMSKTGLSLVMLGLDDQDNLVRCQFVDGEAVDPVVETADTFSYAAFDRWRSVYPFGYNTIGDRKRDAAGRLNASPDLGAFLDTMAGLGVSELPPQRCLLVLDTSLQSLPANVLKAGEDFAARTRAMGTAPSLSWLRHAALRRTRQAGPPQAWISTVSSGDEAVALATMAERLAPTFEKHGIPADHSATLPDTLRDAELAIIGAHGALHEGEDRFFNAVSDEGGQRLRPDQLARAASGAKVVVLFVCSGGRLDAPLEGRGAIGLAHRLLDQGCSAVIGSPWPMSQSVPVYWLPTFLEAWEASLPIIDANAYANDAVSRHLGTEAEVMYAMHVYGDPLVTKV